MTRILRLLLIAAIALPAWLGSAAQETWEQEVRIPLLQEREENDSDLIENSKIEKFDLRNAVKNEGIVHQSKSASKAPQVGTPQTICDGTETSLIFPFRTSYFDVATGSQMIYPASLLQNFLTEGDQITSLTFYARGTYQQSQFSGSWTSNYISTTVNEAGVAMRVGETESTSVTSLDQLVSNRGDCSTVFYGHLSVGSNQNTLTFTFSKPYIWHGGNLIVDFAASGADNWVNTGWYGQTASQASYHYYYQSSSSSSATTQQGSFLPKMTVNYLKLEEYDASLDGNGTFGQVVIDQKVRSTFTVTNTGKTPFTPVVTINGDQEFTLKSTDYGELASGESRYYIVSFAPTEKKSYSGTITLNFEESEAAAAINTITVDLSGIGVESISQNAGEGDVPESLPVYLNYLHQANHGQIIYNASTLNLSSGVLIKKITFHANNILEGQNGGESSTVTLKVGETSNSTYSSSNSNSFLSTNGFAETSLNNIYTGTNEVTFVFDTPYEYKGGNLVVDASCSAGERTNEGVKWIGSNTSSYVGLLQYGNTVNRKQFIPFITIDWVPKEIQGRDDDITVLEDWHISYDWYANGDTQNEKHTNYLDDEEPATDPDQIIALLREVYTNKSIPGNKKRGFTETGDDDHDNNVIYTGVGELERTSSTSARYKDTFGWNVPADPDNPTVLTSGVNTNTGTYNGYTFRYWYMDPEAYMPNQEGVTLLLLELKDDYKNFSSLSIEATSGYAQLREYFSKTIKSARVIKEAKRTGKGLEAGTLFKIDCEKMNMFYLLAKGQLAWMPSLLSIYGSGLDFTKDPCYIYNNRYTDVDRYCDSGVDPSYNPYFFLGHMFEQFSPALSNATSTKNDIYQDLINMNSFGVNHDCPNVPFVQNGHQFMMYGLNDEVADCQDVTDMMFFVPDYRMMAHNNRGTTNIDGDLTQDYFSYNPLIQPTMGLYVIRQNEITPTVEEEEYYMLNLNWVTNLDDFLPSDQQEFELLEVVVDEATGKESYVPVYYMNTNGQYTNGPGGSVIEGREDEDGNIVYTDDQGNDLRVPIVLTMNPGREKNYPSVYVKREAYSQQVTYAIRGRDVTIENGEKKHFLDLQYSNKMSFIVPGTDPGELLLLADATHYSRFDAINVRNAYSNKLTMNNTVDGLNMNNIGGTVMTIKRKPQVPSGSTVSANEVTVATITFAAPVHDEVEDTYSGSYTVEMANQAANEEEFPKCADGSYAGYHANNGGTVKGNGSWTGTYTVNGSNIELGSMVIFDNFVQAIPDDNSHPYSYTYNVTTNYQLSKMMIYVNASACMDQNAQEDWWAWTWTAGDEANSNWVKGKETSESGVFSFSPVKEKVILVRLQKDVAPAWNNDNSGNGNWWNRSDELTVNGSTFTTYWDNGKISGSWSGDKPTAHGNTFRIPIYKTTSQINSYSLTEINEDEDGTMELIDPEFSESIQLSSKTEILRYDVYRWADANRYIIESADGDDEEDIAPTGQAMNQGEKYSITMNGDEDYETNGQVSVSGGSGTATFVDKYPPLKSPTAATEYFYAPVVETFTNRAEGDYNTYGGPLKTFPAGKIELSIAEPQMSEYSWIGSNGSEYAYYNLGLVLNRNNNIVPDGYQFYKVRAWRQILDMNGDPAPDIVGEEDDKYGDNAYIQARKGDQTTKFKFDEFTYPDCNANPSVNSAMNKLSELGFEDAEINGVPVLDSNGKPIKKGEFGALKAGEGSNVQFTVRYIVRIYFAPEDVVTSVPTNTTPSPINLMAEGDSQEPQGFYVVEKSYDYVIDDKIPTAINNIFDANRQVVGTKYYNVAGIESDTPFQGVNIVVTRYSDGSTTTTKILK